MTDLQLTPFDRFRSSIWADLSVWRNRDSDPYRPRGCGCGYLFSVDKRCVASCRVAAEGAKWITSGGRSGSMVAGRPLPTGRWLEGKAWRRALGLREQQPILVSLEGGQCPAERVLPAVGVLHEGAGQAAGPGRRNRPL